MYYEIFLIGKKKVKFKPVQIISWKIQYVGHNKQPIKLRGLTKFLLGFRFDFLNDHRGFLSLKTLIHAQKATKTH